MYINWEAISVIIASLAGAWVGGKIASNTQKEIWKQETQRQCKSVQAAFYGEIYAILRLIETRNYERILDNALLYIKQYGDYPVHDNFLRMKFDTYYQVYKNHIQDIGMMPSETAANITNFYILMFSLLEDVTSSPGVVMEGAKKVCLTTNNDVKKTYINNLAFLLKNDYVLLYELIDAGKKICETLSNDLNIKYTPVFKGIKTPTELKERLNKDYPDNFFRKENDRYDYLVANNGK